MNGERQPVVILLVDDDEEDYMLACDALEGSRLSTDIRWVTDGKDLMDYLFHLNRHAPPASSPRPGIILLDLNMPKMDGREALLAIKAEPSLRQIPVVVMTTSKAEIDIFRSYDSGASGYISKSVTFEGLVSIMKGLRQFWFEIVELPHPSGVQQ
jgi:CheY-like chemotaxis protein